MLSMRHHVLRYLPYPAFVAGYLLLDWLTYTNPLYDYNITPWNPDPALGLVFWLMYGKRAALPWFIALLAGEVLVRGVPAGWSVALLGSAWLTLAYGSMGAVLRRSFSSGAMFDKRSRLLLWLAMIAGGTLLNALGYISLFWLLDLIPHGKWSLALLRFGIGDLVGVVVSMPLLWLLASGAGRRRLRDAVWHWETLGYLILMVLVLWGVFGPFVSQPQVPFRHFYFLFLPVIWAASRQGVCGTALTVFVLQLGLIVLLRWSGAANLDIDELQLLNVMLMLVGLFIGIVVDELRHAANELKHTWRLAAAGEMAAALAHELNQPMTALSAYGKACEYLLERGEGGPLLKDAIERMVVEAGRAADVVRRVRDFFRTGAMRLEAVAVGPLLSDISGQFVLPCREHGVQLQITPADGLSVSADRLQIELVLRNLLSNALESVLNQPLGARRITLTADNLGGGRLRLSVEDSGNGVSSALAARLFEPFVSSKASGLGLGLVLSRSIVEAHGGTLWAEVSDHGIFRFILPLMETGEMFGQ